MKRHRKPYYLLYRIIRNTVFIIFKLFFKFYVEGRDNIPKKGSFIVASNHKSHLDPLILGAAIPQTMHFIARENLFEVRFIGNIIKRVGAIPLRRHYQDFGAVKTSLKVLKEGRPIAIFPEGSRSEDSRLGRPELGIGMLAARSGAPVVPVFIKGSGEALPKHAKFIKLSPIKVHIGEPIRFEKYRDVSDKKQTYRDFTNEVMENIARLKKLYAPIN